MHGFAFNVNTDLGYFDHIVPCGIADPDKSVCSLKSLLDKTLDLNQIKQEVIREFGGVFNLDIEITPSEQLIESSTLNKG